MNRFQPPNTHKDIIVYYEIKGGTNNIVWSVVNIIYVITFSSLYIKHNISTLIDATFLTEYCNIHLVEFMKYIVTFEVLFEKNITLFTFKIHTCIKIKLQASLNCGNLATTSLKKLKKKL